MSSKSDQKMKTKIFSDRNCILGSFYNCLLNAHQ